MIALWSSETGIPRRQAGFSFLDDTNGRFGRQAGDKNGRHLRHEIGGGRQWATIYEKKILDSLLFSSSPASAVHIPSPFLSPIFRVAHCRPVQFGRASRRPNAEKLSPSMSPSVAHLTCCARSCCLAPCASEFRKNWPKELGWPAAGFVDGCLGFHSSSLERDRA